jgi:hypothetical protein
LQFVAVTKNAARTGNNHDVDVIILIYPAADFVNLLAHPQVNLIFCIRAVERYYGDMIAYV